MQSGFFFIYSPSACDFSLHVPFSTMFCADEQQKKKKREKDKKQKQNSGVSLLRKQ